MLRLGRIRYRIGAKYRYNGSLKVLTLMHVDNRRFVFKCGHWCTENVFVNLIDVKKQMYVYQVMHSTIEFY